MTRWSDQAWHAPRTEKRVEADVMTGRIVFKDGTSQPLYYNRMGRFVDYFEMDGARFERVLTCTLQEEVDYAGYTDIRCSACGHAFDDYEQRAAAYCMVCGAKVVGV